MESRDLEDLIEKYFLGTTTPKEAKLVRKHLKCRKQHDVQHNTQFKDSTNATGFLLTLLALIGITTFAYLKLQDIKYTEFGSFQNPEIAYKECQKVLQELSENLNSSLETNTTKD